MAIITFTTDFGQDDWFVGTLKGVILSIHPQAKVLDLSHGVPPGDIRAGAFALAAGCRFFPRGTIHVAIVDPGVGTKRKAIALRTSDYMFIGPDNGVLSWAVRNEKILAVHQLENESLFHLPVSRTFHGRDVFAPVAAHLSHGVPLRSVGRPLKSFVRLPWPEPMRTASTVRGEVLYVDRFGNCVTNIGPDLLTQFDEEQVSVFRGSGRLCSLAGSYGDVAAGSAVAVLGSSGFLEIAVNGGNASRKLRLQRGSKVTVKGTLPR